jgi:hypothetical protein
MKKIIKIAVFSAGIGLTTCFAGHIDLMGYPTADTKYEFDVYTGAKDKWDAATTDEPPLTTGAAVRIAKKFVKTVPERDGMKGWLLHYIKLQRMSYTDGPAEWIYVAHFDADPGGVWNGPLPWIEVPVRLDGTVPKPIITKS